MGFDTVAYRAKVNMEQFLWLLSKRAEVDGRVSLEMSFWLEKGRFEIPPEQKIRN